MILPLFYRGFGRFWILNFIATFLPKTHKASVGLCHKIVKPFSYLPRFVLESHTMILFMDFGFRINFAYTK